MLELLIRLQEMRSCCERTTRNPQLTEREKAAAHIHKEIVRGCLPAEVLVHYSRLIKTEPRLLACQEIFAMAVLVETWRSLSPAKRRKLVGHFATPAPVPSLTTRRNEPARLRGRARRGLHHPTHTAGD